MSRFGRSNRELLALEICRDMAVFVVLNISAITCLAPIHDWILGPAPIHDWIGGLAPIQVDFRSLFLKFKNLIFHKNRICSKGEFDVIWPFSRMHSRGGSRLKQ